MTVESHSSSDDAFGNLEEFGKKSGGEKRSGEKVGLKKTTTRTDLAGLGSDPSTGTGIYVGKKLTGSYDLGPQKKIKDTTLGGMSIEADSQLKAQSESKSSTRRFSKTTIETASFWVTQKKEKKKDCPLVIEEGEAAHESKKHSSPSQQKKEKKPTHISIDISSNSITSLPEEEDHVPLGSGVISGVLGSGGMAKVYKIWNEELEIFRAVKLLLPSNQRDVWDRFQTEAKISAKLHHPNIIEVYAIGQWNGLPYMEMEMIEGEPLSKVSSKYETLPSFVCSAVALQIARALAYAHRQEVQIYGKKYTGIIHRDLKPSNIMINKYGVVKLMDFGVARPVETGLHTVNTTNIIGTMQYFSPEQIDGYPIDQLSDIYSFGAVLYEIMCGLNPFPQSKMIDLVQAKTKNKFKRLEDFNRTFDARLSSVAQICLRTEKSSRYSGSTMLRDQLEEIHRSYQMGNPEDVIVSFFKNPDLMYQEENSRFLKSTHAVTQQIPACRQGRQPVYQPVSAAPEKEFSEDDDTRRCGIVQPEMDEAVEEEIDEYKRAHKKLPLIMVVTVISLLILLGVILAVRKVSQNRGSVYKAGQTAHQFAIANLSDMRGTIE